MAILIVADSSEVHQSLEPLLPYLGQELLYARSGEEVLELLQKKDGQSDGQSIDAVLLNIDQPGERGLEVCRQLKEARPLQDVPILILTRESEEQALQK